MPKLKTKRDKETLLKKMQKQRLKYISILPSLITLINGVCGFASIAFASENEFTKASYMLALAMIADVLDGRVARMSKSTSSFGGQLDSLCDVISFGVAPAFIVLKLFMFTIADVELSVAFEKFLHRFIWLAAGTYVSCTAIRLARFNVENEEDESSHMSFTGLPSPAAAGVIITLIVFKNQPLAEWISNEQTYKLISDIMVYSLPIITFAVGLLMVSRVRYSHIVNQHLKGKKPFDYFIWTIIIIGLAVWYLQLTAMIIFCGFATSGLVKLIYVKLIHKKSDYEITAQQPLADVVNSEENTTEIDNIQ
ncbi:MAG TPA: CDP-diacylglycerol--serine O-phosphatidyltransferase [Sedimentisphaerales bacterium]|nr:CDP-diacylglycerol--serine O-phosphatidyltransferase [Sedimentisphaerales bacterium]